MSSTMTAPAAIRTLRGNAVWRVVKLLARATSQMIVGYWVVMFVIFAAIGVGTVWFGTVEYSVWDWASQSPRYFNVAVGIMLTPSMLTVLVAHGVTRRMFAAASGVFLALVALATSLLWSLGFLVEKGIYAIADWPQTLSNNHLFERPTQVWMVLGEFALMIFGHQVTGLLIGTSFVRFGWWRGIAFIPVAIIPAVVTELLLLTLWVGQWLVDSAHWTRPSLLLSVPGVLLVSVAGLYLNHRLLRPIGLKPTRT